MKSSVTKKAAKQPAGADELTTAAKEAVVEWKRRYAVLLRLPNEASQAVRYEARIAYLKARDVLVVILGNHPDRSVMMRDGVYSLASCPVMQVTYPTWNP